VYGQPEKSDKERNFMILAKAWNKSGSTHKVTEQRLQNNKVYMVEKSASLVDDGISTRTEASNLRTSASLVDYGVSNRSQASNLHARLHDLYEREEQPEMERAYVGLAKEWNSMGSEKEQEVLMSRVEWGMERKNWAPKVLTVQSGAVQKVGVKKEPGALQFLTIQDEECGHTKWLDVHNIEEGDYVTLNQERGVWRVVECLIEPNQVITVGPAYNNNVGTEWIMVNGLKVIVKQGDLVDAEAEVVVNPANMEWCHGGGTARAILVAAGKKLDDECNEFIRQCGSLQVGMAMHTMAGNLQPRIKHVIHAVGPNAHVNNNRQECFELVQRTVLCSLEHAEHDLNAASMALPAISSGLFGVPKIDVAQALYQTILKLDETKPTFVKTV